MATRTRTGQPSGTGTTMSRPSNMNQDSCTRFPTNSKYSLLGFAFLFTIFWVHTFSLPGGVRHDQEESGFPLMTLIDSENEEDLNDIIDFNEGDERDDSNSDFDNDTDLNPSNLARFDENGFKIIYRPRKKSAPGSERDTTWQSISKDFIYPENNTAALTSGMPHPYSPDQCFDLCGETICSDEMERRTDFTKRATPTYRSPRCREKLNIPKYFIIGYSQSGTTFFSDVIRKHDNVRAACHKEIHYFDVTLYLRAQYHVNRKDRMRSITSYFYCFRRVANDTNKIIGDHTVKAIYTDVWYPSWVRAVNRHMKLIVILRDPTKRTYSRFSQLGGGRGCFRIIEKSRCKVMLPYVETMLKYIRLKCPEVQPGGDPSAVYSCGYSLGSEIIDNDTIISGLYEHHLRHWLNFFPPEQFLLLASDELFKDTEKTMARATDFLGLNRYPPGKIARVTQQIGHHTHTRNKAPPDEQAMQLLQEFYEPYNIKLRELLQNTFDVAEADLPF